MNVLVATLHDHLGRRGAPGDLELAFAVATQRACRIADLEERRQALEHILEARGLARRTARLRFDARTVELVLRSS